MFTLHRKEIKSMHTEMLNQLKNGTYIYILMANTYIHTYNGQHPSLINSHSVVNNNSLSIMTPPPLLIKKDNVQIKYK